MPENTVFLLLLVLVLSGLGKSITANSRVRFSIYHKESGSENELSSGDNGSLNRDLVILKRVSSEKLQGPQNNQDNIRKYLTSSAITKLFRSKYNTTVLKNLLKKDLRMVYVIIHITTPFQLKVIFIQIM